MPNPTPNHVTLDLEKRIEAIEALGDVELGKFTKWDWWLCVVGAVVVPAILLWWYAG